MRSTTLAISSSVWEMAASIWGISFPESVSTRGGGQVDEAFEILVQPLGDILLSSAHGMDPGGSQGSEQPGVQDHDDPVLQDDEAVGPPAVRSGEHGAGRSDLVPGGGDDRLHPVHQQADPMAIQLQEQDVLEGLGPPRAEGPCGSGG